MYNIMQVVMQIIGRNEGKELAALLAVYVAVVTSLPEKKKDFDLYTYIRTTCLALLPIRQHPPSPPPPPDPTSNTSPKV